MFRFKMVTTIVLAVSLITAAGVLTPSSGQSGKPPDNVNVVNQPAVHAQQSGAWSVGLTPGATLGISGTPTVNVGTMPTVNVQPALPAQPFHRAVTITANGPSGTKVLGVEGATLGVTALTITNFDASAQQVLVASAVMDTPGTCSATVVAGSDPTFSILVAARTTLHLPYPAALVIPQLEGASCLALTVGTQLTGGSVQVLVTGFSQ
jgi:hypothetical protein